ncbi:MAG: CRISPR-associated helicase Cas3' [Candidatus Aenigmatarchaeota archaeon]
MNNYIWAKGNQISLKDHIKHLIVVLEKLGHKVPEEIREAVKYAILLHDLGKVLPYFQIMSLKNKNYEPFNIDKSLNIYHSLASILFINKNELKKVLKEDCYNFVLSAVAYHHWKNSLEYDLYNGTEKFISLFEYNKSDDLLKKLVEKLREELEEILEKDIIALDEELLEALANNLKFYEFVIPPYKLDFLPKRLGLMDDEKRRWVLISGFLQRCDHYASFCESDKEGIDYTDLVNVEIENIDYPSIKSKLKEKITQKLKEQNVNVDNNIKLWQEYFESYKAKNLVLIAPTGVGKTEFSFLWSGGEKLIYTLPIRSSVEQIFTRARDIFGEEKVGILHSDADVYIIREFAKKGKDKNSEQGSVEEEIEEQNEMMKIYQLSKALSYPVIVATGDQFFPYALRPPLYERIYATLSYSNLVIDEVQAYDPVACAIVIKFIEDIVRLGGRFLLMTATFPTFVKEEISKRIGIFDEVDLYNNQRDKYENLKKHLLKVVAIQNKGGEKSSEKFYIPDEYIKEIVKKADEGNRVLVILNTVKQAKYVYDRIKREIDVCIKGDDQKNLKEDNIVLFHSRFTFNQKQKIKDKIERLFKNPKDENDKEGKILVATQVVEASIDIDADILYTEICPLDALVQRMGRILRRYKENYEYRDEHHNVNIFVFENGYESGNSKVYKTELIENSLILLNFLIECEKENSKESYEGCLNKKIEELKKNKQEGKNKKKEKEEKDKEEKSSLSRKLYINQVLNNIKSSALLLSEYDKYILVNKFYEMLSYDYKEGYLKDFYKTLFVLDAGYMSDKKDDAQEIFRNIMNVSVVDKENKQNFKDAVKSFVEGKIFSYTNFKDKIVAEFVVQIPFYDLKRWIPLSTWIEEIELEQSNIDNKRLRKLKEWCRDIFIYTEDMENIK